MCSFHISSYNDICQHTKNKAFAFYSNEIQLNHAHTQELGTYYDSIGFKTEFKSETFSGT